MSDATLDTIIKTILSLILDIEEKKQQNNNIQQRKTTKQ
jgi:FtsZ-binding cell division protein ZapB